MDFRTLRSVAPIAFVLALSTGVRAEDRTGLGKFVPEGVHFFASWTSSAEVGAVQAHYETAFGRLVDSGFFQDILDVATMELDDATRQLITGVVQTTLKIVGAPNWGELAKNEGAFAFRISLPVPEYLVLFKVDEGTAAARHAELRTMLLGISDLVTEVAGDVLEIQDSEREKIKVSRLKVKAFPVGIAVASRENIVALCTSELLLEEALDFMVDGDAQGSIVEDARFVRATRGLPEGSYSVSFFDLKGYLSFIRGMVNMGAIQAGNDPRARAAIGALNKLLDGFSRIETISTAEDFKDGKYRIDSRVSLGQVNGKPGFIEELIAGQKPVEDYLRAVPKDAIGFAMSSGVDLEKVYDAAIKFVREASPDAEFLIEQFNGIQDQIGFDLKEDLLSWIDGGGGYISLPGRNGGSAQHVVFLRLKDQEKAKTLVQNILAKVKGYLESRGQDMEIAEMDGEDMAPFRTIEIAALPWFRPVIGIPEGVLVIGTSEDAVRRVHETFRGDAPNIGESERFARLGRPDGHLTEVYYHNLEGMLEEYANLIGTVGFVASLLPEDRDTRPAIKLGLIASKFARFLKDLDIVGDQIGWSVYDPEKHELRSRAVTSFRLP